MNVQAELKRIRDNYVAGLGSKLVELDDALNAAQRDAGEASLKAAIRIFHGFKGACGTFQMEELAAIAGAVEDALVIADAPSDVNWADLRERMVALRSAVADVVPLPQTSATGSSGRVLVVSLNPENARAATEALGATYQVDACATVDSATEQLKQNQFVACVLAQSPDAVPSHEAVRALLDVAESKGTKVGCTESDSSVAAFSLTHGVAMVEFSSLASFIEAAPVSKPGAPKVLLVDDDDLAAEAFAVVLRGFHFDVTVVNDPRLAVDTLTAGAYESVILDVTMPHLSGFEVCRLMRDTRVGAQVPIFMRTASVSEKMRARSLGAGASDIIQKQFAPDAVERRVRPSLELYRAKINAGRTDAASGLLRRGAWLEAMSGEDYVALSRVVFEDTQRFEDKHGVVAVERALDELSRHLSDFGRAGRDLWTQWRPGEFICGVPGVAVQTAEQFARYVAIELQGLSFASPHGEFALKGTPSAVSSTGLLVEQTIRHCWATQAARDAA